MGDCKLYKKITGRCKMKIDSKTYIVKDRGSVGKIVFIVGLALLLISLFGYFNDSKQFYFLDPGRFL